MTIAAFSARPACARALGAAFSAALAALLLLGASLPVRAAEIGYVDARQLIEQAPQGRDEVAQLEAEFAERRRTLQADFESFRAQEAELQKDGLDMAPEEREAKTAALLELQRGLKRNQRAYNEDFTRRRNERLAGLEKLITKAIIAVAKREGLDLVFQQAVYASEDINLTDQVLAELTRMHQEQG
ncbi:MAG: OmpH family outer membrane protein [bacterium]